MTAVSRVLNVYNFFGIQTASHSFAFLTLKLYRKERVNTNIWSHQHTQRISLQLKLGSSKFARVINGGLGVGWGSGLYRGSGEG